MQAIALVQTQDRNVNQLQGNIKKAVDPVLANPLVDGQILQDVELVTGLNTINHGLGRNLQGWFLVRQRASASVYDTQDDNLNPALTLLLTASAPVVVNLYVF